MDKKGAYLLVVDDEAGMRKTLLDILDQAGYAVTAVGTGKEAVAEARKRSYNIVISDIKLPDLDGLRVLEEMRAIDPQVLVILITAYATVDTTIGALRRGVYDYITKPFEPDELLITVERALEKQRLSADNIHLREIIAGLAAAIDAKDHYTHGHSEQVMDYAVAIAQEMGMPMELVEDIREASLLHDVGKIGISEKILLKPGPLTKEEYEQVKQHPIISKKILEPVSSLRRIIPAIYHHHECYDGSGYPEGLKGVDIPIESRILAVADAYQAMVTDRAYRQALPEGKAVAELKNNAGKQFDPKIVDVFLRFLERENKAKK